MNDTASLVYVYGIVRRDFDASRAPGGLDDAAVMLTGPGAFAGLASRVPRTHYAPEIIEEKSGDVQWLSPRALAHDRVLTWAHDRGAVIPLPMFSMWASEASLTASLEERSPELARTYERVANADEFGLRVHRKDAVMLTTIHEIDPAMAELSREAAAASPGQRYLIERKVAERGKAAVRSASQRIAKELFDRLDAVAREAIARPLTPAAGAVSDATLVLNAAFLVDRVRLDEFRALVGSELARLEPRGLAFDFTGPWPPYHFAK